ncbi:PP2C family protein-serine/threonine phosphatase [Kitasatospora sp. NPDC001175]|uniref:PP2C family protein-serine/threonine phosphatase n=1 Tax=Kitasatospora sp. NPDC001175 TaxID=3157103 RepID=UPI003D08F45A
MSFRLWSHLRRSLLLIPFGLIVVVCVVDILAPPDVHLGPLLVAAPAITASFARARGTALVAVLAVLGQVAIGVQRSVIGTENIQVQIAALVVVSALVVVFTLVRERHSRELTKVRSVAAAAQKVLLQPLPGRAGPLQIASLYLPAEAEAQMGGDLYAAARRTGGTRMIIGDVRGKGLAAINLASLVLGAFRAAAHRQATLTNLGIHLDGAVHWDAVQWRDAGPDHEPSEHSESFVTAMVLDIPDDEPLVHLVDCGHPPALLVRDGRTSELRAPSSLPLGLGIALGLAEFEPVTFGFGPGDLLLLYTDGVIEARDDAGAFYPLAERAAAWSGDEPEDLLRYLRDGLLAHVQGRLGDDAAMVAIRRTAAPPAEGAVF